MMYALEHLTRQGPGPQWKQYAVCANKDLLERIAAVSPARMNGVSGCLYSG